DAQISDHPPVPPARRAMREEVRPIVGAAPGRDGHLADAQLGGVPYQHRSQVDMPRSRRRPPGCQLLQHFRTYFIARPTNADATMHYNLLRYEVGSEVLEQLTPGGAT